MRMTLDRVTITGADDSVDISSLAHLSQRFPFVEWGILASESATGRGPRYPSLFWMSEFRAAIVNHRLSASLHLCGKWARDMLVGKLPPRVLDLDEPGSSLVWFFQRVQLNFRPEKTHCLPVNFMAVLKRLGQKQFIFQLGVDGNAHMEAVADEADCRNVRLDCVGLFDASGGRGELPPTWPKPHYLHCVPGEHGEGVEVYDYCGYAGGLGPDNLERELPRIAEAADGARFWIDMETGVRSECGMRFDLDKVRRVLEVCEPLVKGGAT